MEKNTLIEICTEELPPKQLKTLSIQFALQMQSELQANLFSFGEVQTFATPRRLAILIHGLSQRASDQVKERKGPSTAQAQDVNGEATPALLGFAKSCGVDIKNLSTKIIDGKTHYVFLENKTGESIFEVLPIILMRVLSKLPAKKRMHWGDGSVEFIRPLRSVLMLYGDEIVPASILGVTSGRQTRGHRQHESDIISISSPECYESQMLKADVMIDFEKRKQFIMNQTQDLIKAHFKGATPVWSEELIEEVTGLVEYPNVLLGQFSSDFLKLPREILIAVMRDHQRYFAIQDEAGQLLPYFVIISNIKSRMPTEVIAGNETVLRARFSDALFFYEEDLKKSWFSLDNSEKLKGVFFQGQSSLWDKTGRVEKIGNALANHLFKSQYENPEWRAILALAIRCSKIDLLTGIVGEFPELQGVMGQVYVLQDAHFKQKYFSKRAEWFLDFALALKEQYLPRFSGDELPNSTWGSLLSLSDRLDSFVFLSRVQGLPTGSKDPFGLRRMMIGIIRLILKNQWQISLKTCFELSIHALDSAPSSIDSESQSAWITSLLIFSKERFKQEIQTQYAFSPELCEAVSSVDEMDFNFYDNYLKASALHALQLDHSIEFLQLAALHKRVHRILSKNKQAQLNARLSEAEYQAKEEQALYQQYQHCLDSWRVQFDEKEIFSIQDYVIFCQHLLQLKAPLSDFFEHLLVEEPQHKVARLSLLNAIYHLINRFADFSKLSSAS